jgi:uncharacterized short protein YbdD (DUF466 family)
MRISRVIDSVRWFFTSLMGERAYDDYVSHLAMEHPGLPPMDEREFWAEKYREKSRNPGTMCC